MTVFLVGFVLGIFVGVFLGNKGFREKLIASVKKLVDEQRKSKKKEAK